MELAESWYASMLGLGANATGEIPDPTRPWEEAILRPACDGKAKEVAPAPSTWEVLLRRAPTGVCPSFPVEPRAHLGGEALRRRWVGWGVAILVLLACSVWIDVAHVLNELSRISLGWVALILAIITVDRLLMAWKWSVLLKALGVRLPLPMLCRVYYQTSFASAFLPSGIGGDLLRAHLVGRASAMPAEVYASIAMERGLGFLSAANWAAIGTAIVAVWRAGDVPWRWVAGLGLAVVACNAAFLFSLTPGFHARVLQYTARFGQRHFLGSLHRLYLAHSQYSRAKAALARYAALTLGEHLIQMSWMLLTALSLGWEVEPFVFLAATAVQLMLYRIPISPDGWGVGELTAIGVYGLLGIAPARAFSLALLEHALRVVAVIPGLWFLVRTSRFVRRPDSHGRIPGTPRAQQCESEETE